MARRFYFSLFFFLRLCQSSASSDYYPGLSLRTLLRSLRPPVLLLPRCAHSQPANGANPCASEAHSRSSESIRTEYGDGGGASEYGPRTSAGRLRTPVRMAGETEAGNVWKKAYLNTLS